MFGKPASRRSGLKCFLTKYSSLVGSPCVVVKIRSANTESHAASASPTPPFSFRSRSSTHICSLTTRRLRTCFVSAKVHWPSFLWRVRTTLMVPRSQSMSRQQRARYSLGRIPVVRATAKMHPCGECDVVPEKQSSLLCRQHRHFSALLTRKYNCQRGIIEEQLPTYH